MNTDLKATADESLQLAREFLAADELHFALDQTRKADEAILTLIKMREAEAPEDQVKTIQRPETNGGIIDLI